MPKKKLSALGLVLKKLSAIERYKSASELKDATMLGAILSVANLCGEVSQIQNPEWKWVMVDSEDKILMGIRQDDTWYIGVSVSEFTDVIVASYQATQGAFADKPSSPHIGQLYFCTDRQTAEGQTDGIPIYYSGSGWVDALGRTVS